eukprot:scaffold73_cov252-Pinguiococcus_pyrenoidosus.AAC.24
MLVRLAGGRVVPGQRGRVWPRQPVDHALVQIVVIRVGLDRRRQLCDVVLLHVLGRRSPPRRWRDRVDPADGADRHGHGPPLDLLAEEEVQKPMIPRPDPNPGDGGIHRQAKGLGLRRTGDCGDAPNRHLERVVREREHRVLRPAFDLWRAAASGLDKEVGPHSSMSARVLRSLLLLFAGAEHAGVGGGQHLEAAVRHKDDAVVCQEEDAVGVHQLAVHPRLHRDPKGGVLDLFRLHGRELVWEGPQRRRTEHGVFGGRRREQPQARDRLHLSVENGTRGTFSEAQAQRSHLGNRGGQVRNR